MATVATAFSDPFLIFAICRFFTGAGIGGEYAAINSAIDELIPARVRGTVDLLINGSFWLGTAAGAALSILLLNEDIFAADVGWRLAFGLGAVLGVGILIVRRHVPESPRWMFIHGKLDEADELVDDIEARSRSPPASPSSSGREVDQGREQENVGLVTIAKTVFGAYPRRTIVGLALFIGQAFLYNAVFFTYALVLSKFYGVKPASVGYYIIPFALGNFLGPLCSAACSTRVGRKPMIAGTYILSGVLLIITAFLFKADVWTAETQTAAWCVIFFFASAGASAAYLTVSEIFPMETRAMAIAFFYAVGTAVGGITGPLLFGKLIETGKETNVFWGYVLGASLMIVAGIIQAVIGVEAARKNLEDVAKPLSAEEAEESRARQAVARAGPYSYSPFQSLLLTRARRGHRRRGRGAGGRAAEGELSRDELGRRVNCRLWGPGRYRHALATAQARGEIRRTGRGRFGRRRAPNCALRKVRAGRRVSATWTAPHDSRSPQKRPLPSMITSDADPDRRRDCRNSARGPPPPDPPLNEPLPFPTARAASCARSPASRRAPSKRVDVLAAAADQLELAVDVPERLLEDLAAAVLAGIALAPLGAQLGAGLLGLEQRLQLVEAEAEQLLEAQGV